MDVRRRTLVFLTLAFFVWAATATGFAGYYQIRYTEIVEALEELEGSILKIDVLIDYGNSTEVWHNETVVTPGSTPLDALLAITESVELKGNYIAGIDGIVEGGRSGWTWWFWNAEKSDWDWSLQAVNEYLLHPDQIISFKFVSW